MKSIAILKHKHFTLLCHRENDSSLFCTYEKVSSSEKRKKKKDAKGEIKEVQYLRKYCRCLKSKLTRKSWFLIRYKFSHAFFYSPLIFGKAMKTKPSLPPIMRTSAERLEKSLCISLTSWVTKTVTKPSNESRPAIFEWKSRWIRNNKNFPSKQNWSRESIATSNRLKSRTWKSKDAVAHHRSRWRSQGEAGGARDKGGSRGPR